MSNEVKELEELVAGKREVQIVVALQITSPDDSHNNNTTNVLLSQEFLVASYWDIVSI